MPRPQGDARKAETVNFWLPSEIGESIEGRLIDPVREDGFRGNIYHLVDDQGMKTRLPVHAELQRKLDGIRIDIAAGIADDWVVIKFIGKTDDEHRHYDVDYWPKK